MPQFQVHGSPDLKRLQYLTDLRTKTEVTFDDQQSLYVYPQEINLPPLTEDQYHEVMERFASEYKEGEIEQLQEKVLATRQQIRDDYEQLKQLLLADAGTSGDDNPPFVFDDEDKRIDIDYAFKDCMDRLGTASKNLIKKMTVPDPNADKRHFQDLFRDELATPEVKKKYEDTLKTAVDDFRSQGDQAYQEPDSEPDLSAAQTGGDCIEAIFTDDNQPGMCLGDLHGNSDSKDFLVNNMPQLKQAGVDTLFIEHFWQEHQQLLDDYVNGPANAPIPPPLEAAINKMESPASFQNMLVAANQHKMRIVGLDSFDAKVPQKGDPRNPDHRAARFNAVAAEVVNREKGNGKFLLMAGEDHINTHFSGVPGLAQILKVPGFKTAQGGLIQRDPENKQNRGMRSEAEQLYYDAFVEQFYAKQPDLLVPPDPRNPDDYNALEPRRNAVRSAANTLARKAGPSLAALKPDAIKKLAAQAADRGFAEFTKGPITVDMRNPGGQISVAAGARSADYNDTLVELKAAVRSGDWAKVMQMIKTDPKDERLLTEDMGSPERGSTVLHAACRFGDVALVKELLAQGCNPNCQDDKGNTPMHMLCLAPIGPNYIQAGDALIAAGAKLDVENQAKHTPVHLNLLNIVAQPNDQTPGQMMTTLKKGADYGAARVPRRALHLKHDVLKGDVTVLNSLPSNSPILNEAFEGNKCLIHLAAENGQLGVLQALANQGANMKQKGDGGDNVLHYACKADAPDDPNVVTFLSGQLGDDRYQINDKGETALHLAAGWGHTQITRQLLQDPQANRLQVADNGGLTPLHHAIASNKGKEAEQEFYATDPTLAQINVPNNPSTVDMVTAITVVKNPKYLTDNQVTIRDLFQELYDNPLLRPVLEVAAKDGFGGRLNRAGDGEAFRIFINDSEGAGGLAGGSGGMGNYEGDGNRLIVGGQQQFTSSAGRGAWLDAVKGTLIHEMSHHASEAVFHNRDLPFANGDDQASPNYIAAFVEDVKTNAHLAITEEEKQVRTYIASRLTKYAGPLQVGDTQYTGAENLQLEMIVGVAQAVACFGEPLVRKLFPNFTAYFDQTFNQSCRHACDNDQVLSALNLDTNRDGNGRQPPPNCPEKMFASGSKIDTDVLWDMIQKDFTIGQDNINPMYAGMPVFSDSCFELKNPGKQNLERVKPAILKLLQKGLASGVPPQISTESLRALVQAVSKSCSTAPTDRELIKAVDTHCKTFATKATQDFENDYLASSKACLERKLTKGYNLSVHDTAELMLVRAAEKASGDDASSLNVDPGKYSKFIKEMSAQLSTLKNDTVQDNDEPVQDKEFLKNIDKLVNSGVDLLVQDKEFKVKSKAKKRDTGHVSIKVDVDKKWLLKLIEIAD
jgi:ankyrin repeat protein